MHSPSLICTTPREHQAFLGIIRPPNRDLAMAHGHPRLEKKIPYAALAARGVLITIGAALTVTFQKPMSILDGNTVRPFFRSFPLATLIRDRTNTEPHWMKFVSPATTIMMNQPPNLTWRR